MQLSPTPNQKAQITEAIKHKLSVIFPLLPFVANAECGHLSSMLNLFDPLLIRSTYAQETIKHKFYVFIFFAQRGLHNKAKLIFHGSFMPFHDTVLPLKSHGS